MKFTTQPMLEIFSMLKDELKTNSQISFDILNPDLVDNSYAGNIVEINNQKYIYRGYKSWIDLAEILMCKMMTPKINQDNMVTITFKKLEIDSSFHLDTEIPKEEKYGIDSKFAQINKMEEPAFLYYYKEALENVNIENRERILNLGINRGDEFGVIKDIVPKYKDIQFVGVDHSKSAIKYAKEKFNEPNFSFFTYDINKLESLILGKFNLLISIGTLQSPSINFKPFFMSLVQNYLKKDGAIILGFPNSRWIGGEVIYGAKAPNYKMSEQSLLYNDVIFCKKYLQQHKYRVTLTGKQYLFLTATKIKDCLVSS